MDVTSHPVPTVASPSILPCTSDSFARQEDDEELEAAVDCDPFELDDAAGLAESAPGLAESAPGLAESAPGFEPVFDGVDSPPELDPSGELSEEPFAAPARLLASARLSVR
jgi:hypothetical protein